MGSFCLEWQGSIILSNQSAGCVILAEDGCPVGMWACYPLSLLSSQLDFNLVKTGMFEYLSTVRISEFCDLNQL